MKRAAVPVLLCFAVGLSPVLAFDWLQVTSPPAGAVLTAGEPVTVEWTGGDPSWSVHVYLADVTEWTAVALVAGNVPNSGALDWTFPTSLRFGGPCNGHTYLFYIEEVGQQQWTYGPEFTVACETTVEVDIHPGSDPNSINPRSQGVMPVAILTTSMFDAATVDPGSLAFGPSGAAPAHSGLEDVDGDGDLDLLLHVPTQDTGITCGATSATLTGQTTAGRAIEGVDSVRTVGCR